MATTSLKQRIADELGVPERQVSAAVGLLDGGATVPFIARSRKAATGGPHRRVASIHCRGEEGARRLVTPQPRRAPFRVTHSKPNPARLQASHHPPARLRDTTADRADL